MPAAIPDEQAALLGAIVAHPEEDAPRLVYADWLQEHGDEDQAQFIRQAIELARSRDPGAEKALTRLYWDAEKAARGWLAAIGLPHAEDPGFERGLPDGVCYRDGNHLLEEVEALFARLPIRELGLWGQGGKLQKAKRLPELFDRPELARLTMLWISNGGGPLPPGTWGALLRCPHLGGLRHLWLNSCGLDSDHLFEFAGCPRFAGLEGLDLSENPFNFMGQFAILRSPHLKGLKELSIWNGEDPEDTGLIAEVVARFGSDAPLTMDLTDQRVTR